MLNGGLVLIFLEIPPPFVFSLKRLKHFFLLCHFQLNGSIRGTLSSGDIVRKQGRMPLKRNTETSLIRDIRRLEARRLEIALLIDAIRAYLEPAKEALHC